MSDQRMGCQGKRRAFRPTLDGTLETRVLMAASAIRAQTASGGQAVVVTVPDGTQFFVSVAFGGTVRATPASGGRANLIVNGTNSGSLLEVNRILPKQINGTAHTFQTALAGNVTRLNIASINVVSGSIDAIEGYQTADLSGPITVGGSVRVDRIALSSILPGGSISVSGDLNTLDIYRNVQLTSTTGITVGRDLNWFEAYGNVEVGSGSRIAVGRDLGGTFQVAKGSGNAGQGVNISGNLAIDSGGSINIGRSIPDPAGIVINGDFAGADNFTVGGNSLATYLNVIKPMEGQPENVEVLGNVSA